MKPGGKFASISVVFAKQPSEKLAYEAVIAEVLKAIDRTQHTMLTSAYAQLGAQSDQQVGDKLGPRTESIFPPNLTRSHRRESLR